MPGVLERLPRRLQQQPLLRVHRQRLARADPEEAGVEVADAVDEAAAARVHRAELVGVRVVEPLQVPAAVVRQPETASRPSATSSHSSAGDATPPG